MGNTSLGSGEHANTQGRGLGPLNPSSVAEWSSEEADDVPACGR